MNKIVQYINEKEIDEMVKSIINGKKDIRSVIQQIRQSRVEFQAKSQKLQDELVKYMEGANGK